jgi:acyl-CoA thioester hydrolase
MKTEISGRLEGIDHVFPVRVYYEDTDAAGIVYYANYLRFAERARTEMVRLTGGEGACVGEDGVRVAFAVRHCTADYRRPAKLDDLLNLRTRIRRVHGASLDMEQMVMRGDEELVSIYVKLACLSHEGKPARLPVGLKQRLLSFTIDQQQD